SASDSVMNTFARPAGAAAASARRQAPSALERHAEANLHLVGRLSLPGIEAPEVELVGHVRGRLEGEARREEPDLLALVALEAGRNALLRVVVLDAEEGGQGPVAREPEPGHHVVGGLDVAAELSAPHHGVLGDVAAAAQRLCDLAGAVDE